MDENSLLITHHPVIFKGIKNLVPYNFSTKYSIKLIQKNCSLIAMHTNFDKTHLNRYVAEKILGLEGNQEDFVFYADVETTFEDFAKKIKEKLQISNLKVVKAKENIKRVAVTTGAGMSLLDYINADCFLTGDIKYHEAMDALSRGISLIDIGHFESEKYFTDVLFPIISELIEEMEIVKLNSKNPFSYI
jgi:dinuclear metal center YbgI/SA1388 family protein